MCTLFPACYIDLPDGTPSRRAPFYLSMEEYIARQLPTGTYLFSWILPPTVVMGRNQIAHQEFDLDFCQQHHIDVVRRKSGGGAIFADEHNVMWSLITPGGAVEPIFADYSRHIAAALETLGVQTEVSGRNDILIQGGGKVCGNAFYHLPQRNIVHGTMLYDTQAELMQGALKPDLKKLQEKGVKSVRSRISLLKDYLSISLEEVCRRLRTQLCDRSICLTEKDVKAIENIAAGYDDPDYLYGHSAHSDVSCQGRIAGCGTLELHFELKGSLISGIAMHGDYFETSPAQEAFENAFIPCPFTRQALRQAVATHHPEQSIRGLSEEALVRLLEDSTEL